MRVITFKKTIENLQPWTYYFDNFVTLPSFLFITSETVYTSCLRVAERLET